MIFRASHAISLLPGLACSLWLLCAVAGAAPSSAPAASREAAKALIKSGEVNYRLFKFDLALADYMEAYRLSQHPAIVFNIAQAYRQLKNYEKASFYYKLFLADWRKKYPDRPPPNEAEVKGHIDRLAKQIIKRASEAATASPRRGQAPVIPLVKVELEGLRAGARILVDGRAREGGPTLSVVPGERRLRVEVDGFHPWEKTVTVRAGKNVTRTVNLEVVDRRALWLSTSVGLTAAAAGVLAMGIYFNVRHDDFILDTPEADDARELAVIGYAVAGGVAAAAIAAWTIYLLHRRSVKRLTAGTATGFAAIAPLPGGGAAAAILKF